MAERRRSSPRIRSISPTRQLSRSPTRRRSRSPTKQRSRLPRPRRRSRSPSRRSLTPRDRRRYASTINPPRVVSLPPTPPPRRSPTPPRIVRIAPSPTPNPSRRRPPSSPSPQRADDHIPIRTTPTVQRAVDRFRMLVQGRVQIQMQHQPQEDPQPQNTLSTTPNLLIPSE